MAKDGSTSEDVIFWGDGPPRGPSDWIAQAERCGATVRKIVVGQLVKSNKPISAALPERLAELFPHLTHLHLWGLSDGGALPPLPPSLRCLDIQECPNLEAIVAPGAALPRGLQTLVVNGCPHVQLTPTLLDGLDELEDLSLRGSSVDDACIARYVACVPSLRALDLSGATRLTAIPSWPPVLLDIRLEGCTGLDALPPKWPSSVRMAVLRGAKALKKIPDRTPASLDVLDLAGMESLPALPAHRGKPRTLYLFGSGVRTPPASQHGESDQDNVAAKTATFFAEKDAFGEGEVRRCRVLFLGNGAAGKTCLALALDPQGNPAQAALLKSTHGVRFQPWTEKLKIADQMEEVDIHGWDFGGQEIYHGTHRIFMERGAVFVVLWKHDQPTGLDARIVRGYRDERRPLQYWIDFINLSCHPFKPRIAVVCSHQAKRTAEIDAAYREALPDDWHRYPLYVIDSLTRDGQIEDLRKWIRAEVAALVEAEGTHVPSYWAIAQSMVQEWLVRLNDKADLAFAAAHRQLPFETFKAELSQAIEQRCSPYPDLIEAVQSGAFSLTDERLRWTLEFLNNSGWVYWSDRLLEGRVIVGQEWALEGIYTLLERRDGTTLYDALEARGGKFTRSNLREWGWDQKYSPEEQELLLSFLIDCGRAFPLTRLHGDWRDEEIFISVEHLPFAEKQDHTKIFNRFSAEREVHSTTIELPLFHRLHWQQFLVEEGKALGKSADYARDGFLFYSGEGSCLQVSVRFESEGIGASIVERASGDKAQEAAEAMAERIKKTVTARRGEADTSEPSRHGTPRPIRVFISYAWDDDQNRPLAESAYEAPVSAIESALNRLPSVIALRDKHSMDFGDRISRFTREAGLADLVVAVHSDRFHRSINCVYGELQQAMKSLMEEANRHLKSVIVPVELASSGIRDDKGREAALTWWDGYSGKMPTRNGVTLDRKEVIETSKTVLRWWSEWVSDAKNVNIQWQGEGHNAIEAIIERVNARIEELARAAAGGVPSPRR